MDNAERLGVNEQLYKAMKALEYIFKFIVRSRVLFNQYVSPPLPGASSLSLLPSPPLPPFFLFLSSFSFLSWLF